jgi:hypothetical protein
MRVSLVLSCLLVTACAASPDDASDQAAEDAPPQPVDGKVGGIDFTGLYHISKSTLYNNDVSDLELHSDGSYVRARCYHTSCALQLPQTGTYDLYTSATGHIYVRFRWDGDTKIADVYEITSSAKGISLRKTYTSGWFTLFHEAPSAACGTTGGAWDDTAQACACPDSQYSDSGYTAFVAGAGGCVGAPSGSEAHCDASGGSYTDDEMTAISTYCVCKPNQYVAVDGSCTAI